MWNKNREIDFPVGNWIYLFAALLAIGALIFKGYQFPSGNHGQEIPPILSILNGDLYRFDISVQSYLKFGVRYYYQQVIAFMVRDIGLSISLAYFLAYFAALFSFILAILKIAGHLLTSAEIRDSTIKLASSAVLVVWCLTQINSWGSELFISLALPSTFAMGFASWGIYAGIKRRWLVAYGLFGAAAIFQFLVGLLPGTVLLGGLLYDAIKNRNFRVALGAMLLWGTGLAVVYVPMAINEIKPPAGFDFVETFGLFRVPHHWSPSTGSKLGWISDLFLAASALLLANSYRKSPHAEIRWISVLCASGIIIAAGAVLLNFLFVDVWHSEIIGKLQFQRIMPFGHLLIFLMLTLVIAESLAKGRWLFAALMITSPLIKTFGVAAAVGAYLHTTELSSKLKNALLLVLFLILPASYVLFENERALSALKHAIAGGALSVQSLFYGFFALGLALLVAFLQPRFRSATLAILLVLGASLALLIYTPTLRDTLVLNKLPHSLKDKASKKLNFGWSIDRTASLPGRQLATALKEHSDVDDIVMLPPTWDALTDTFQLLSQRSAYFVFKNVPYDGNGVWLWSERAKMLLGTEHLTPYMSKKEVESHFDAQSPSKLESLARANNACFLVLESSFAGFDGEILMTEKVGRADWNLWSLKNCDRKKTIAKRMETDSLLDREQQN